MKSPVTVLGAGCTGPLLALLLARRGFAVRVFERRPDPRRGAPPAGRSINFALAARGAAALERAGLADRVRPLLTPMRGRLVHERGQAPRFLGYGQRPDELLWSVARADLNRLLIDAAEAAGVEFRFEHACRGADFENGRLALEDLARGRRFELPMAPLFAADGASSALRAAMVAAGLARAREDTLGHGYKEFSIAAGAGGRHRLAPDALHIWPRGGYMLIALPNADGTLTATLFLPTDGEPPCFASLATGSAARALFEREFPEVLALVPDLEAQFASNPVGRMSTVYAAPWHVGGQALLIGDAAHAIVPFHGQGMNCAFEDCRLLDGLLAAPPDWAGLFARFEAARREDTAAIARMALENYLEMRDTVREPRFALLKELSLELERLHPERFIPRYSMVMFHAEIPYAEAERRGRTQAEILAAATAGRAGLAEVDRAALAAAIDARLAPLTPQGGSASRT